MKKLSTALLMIFIFASCQEPLQVNSEDGQISEPVNETNIINNLCDDGTLDCIVENTTSNNLFVNNNGFLLHEYDQCLRTYALSEQCTGVPETFMPLDGNGQIDMSNLSSTTPSDITDNFLTSPISCTQINGQSINAEVKEAAVENCTEEYLEEDSDWATDDFEFPENARVLEVEIKTCISESHRTALLFSGAQMVMDTIYRNDGVVSLLSVPRVNKCGPGGIFDGTKVNYRPYTGSSLSINGRSFKTTPFTGAAAKKIEKKHKNFWHVPIGIPNVYRKEMDLAGSRWFMSKVEANFIWDIRLSTGNGGGSAFATSEYVSKARDLAYPLTMVRFSRPLTSYKLKTTITFVASPNQQ